MKFAGVVVLYNPDDKIYKNINTYLKYLDKLYIVDNTPNVDLSKKFNDKKIEYIPLNENKGIAYALNFGAKRALSEKAEWLLTMDQDSSFKGDGLNKMKEFLIKLRENSFLENIIDIKYKNIGILSPLHITERNCLEQLSGLSRPLEVMTSGNLINLKAYKKIKGFKDWMFIDCVDFDYCLNLRSHNYDIIQLNFVKLNHKLGDIVERKFLNKVTYVDNHNAIRRYYITRNRHYLYDMYQKQFPYYCNLEIKRTRIELVKIWLYEKNKIAKTKAIFRGYIDYKFGRKGKYDYKK